MNEQMKPKEPKPYGKLFLVISFAIYFMFLFDSANLTNDTSVFFLVFIGAGYLCCREIEALMQHDYNDAWYRIRNNDDAQSMGMEIPKEPKSVAKLFVLVTIAVYCLCLVFSIRLAFFMYLPAIAIGIWGYFYYRKIYKTMKAEYDVKLEALADAWDKRHMGYVETKTNSNHQNTTNNKGATLIQQVSPINNVPNIANSYSETPKDSILEWDDWEDDEEDNEKDYAWQNRRDEWYYYGLDPRDYETEEEYDEALQELYDEEQRRIEEAEEEERERQRILEEEEEEERRRQEEEEELQRQMDYDNWYWFYGPGSDNYYKN